jgi:hypothetical protein
MSEAGNIDQVSNGDEMGVVTAMHQVGFPSPKDVNPLVWDNPLRFIPDYSPNCVSQLDEIYTPDPTNPNQCRQFTELSRALYTSPTNQLTLNPRDGLVRLIGYTQGEARFIDLNITGAGDGNYQKEYDFVPLHSEPYVDTNDNGQWDIDEPYFDVNRNGQWEQDVFGRNEEEQSANLCVEKAIQQLRERPGIEAGTDVFTLENCPLQSYRDFTNTIDMLKVSNPNSLQTTVWASTQVLWVSPFYPESQNPDTFFKVDCPQSQCLGIDPGGFLPNLPDSCRVDAVPGLDLYLGPNSNRNPIPILFSPTDDQRNCLVPGSTISLDSTQGINIGGGGFNGLNIKYITPDYTVLYEDCFDELRPTIPQAKRYGFSVIPIRESEQPQEGEVANYTFTVETLSIELQSIDYLLDDPLTRTHIYTLSIGYCK